MLSDRKKSFDLAEILGELNEDEQEPGKIAQKLLDTVVLFILQAKGLKSQDASTGYHEIMNVSDYHILYNFFKTRLDIALYEQENLESVSRILYERAKDLILHSDGVTNGQMKALGHTLLHEVMGYHRDHFHSDDSEHDCGCLLVKMLISYNADVNAQDKYGTTPFHESAANHCERTMKMLLSTGRVDVAQKDFEGESALFYLVENIVDKSGEDVGDGKSSDLVVKRLDACLRLLLEKKLNFKELGKNGDSAFHRLLQNYYVSLQLVINFVEMCGPAISLKNKFGFTPIHVCVRTGCEEKFSRERVDILRYLCILSCKEDLDAGDVALKTPLIHSIINGNKTFCRILFSNGANIEQPDKHGLSPLHYACMCSDESVVDTLLDCGVNVHLRDHAGDFAIVYAAAHGRMELVKKLYPFYEQSRELHNRLLTVADFNGHRKCHEMLKMIKEWDIIDLETPKVSKITKVEVELREVDAWLRQKQEYLRRNRRLYFITPMEKFYILQSLRENENHEVCNAIIDLVTRISEEINERNQLFRFKPVLVGSMAEETKIGQIDSLEFHCEMYELSQSLDLAKSAVKSDKQNENGSHPTSGFVRTSINNRDNIKNMSNQGVTAQSKLVQTIDDIAYLSSFNMIRAFTKAISEVLCDEQIWQNLQLSWHPDTKELARNTSTIEVHWVGKNYKYKKILIHLIPTVFLMEEVKPSTHLVKLLKNLDNLSETSHATRLIAQNVKSFDVDRPDLLWKVDYTPFELSVFRLVPCIGRLQTI